MTAGDLTAKHLPEEDLTAKYLTAEDLTSENPKPEPYTITKTPLQYRLLVPEAHTK